jgi:hypothetical protein
MYWVGTVEIHRAALAAFRLNKKPRHFRHGARVDRREGRGGRQRPHSWLVENENSDFAIKLAISSRAVTRMPYRQAGRTHARQVPHLQLFVLALRGN